MPLQADKAAFLQVVGTSPTALQWHRQRDRPIHASETTTETGLIYKLQCDEGCRLEPSKHTAITKSLKCIVSQIQLQAYSSLSMEQPAGTHNTYKSYQNPVPGAKGSNAMMVCCNAAKQVMQEAPASHTQWLNMTGTGHLCQPCRPALLTVQAR
jgi:hypothetical protein